MKLPHWTQLLLAMVKIVIAQVLAWNGSGALQVPMQLVTALTIANTLIGMLSDSVQTGVRQKIAAAASRSLSLFVLVLFTASTSGCGYVQPILPELTRLEGVIVSDLAAGDTDEQIASDVCRALGALVPPGSALLARKHARRAPRAPPPAPAVAVLSPACA